MELFFCFLFCWFNLNISLQQVHFSVKNLLIKFFTYNFLKFCCVLSSSNMINIKTNYGFCRVYLWKMIQAGLKDVLKCFPLCPMTLSNVFHVSLGKFWNIVSNYFQWCSRYWVLFNASDTYTFFYTIISPRLLNKEAGRVISLHVNACKSSI